jgi:hypothetical protein
MEQHKLCISEFTFARTETCSCVCHGNVVKSVPEEEEIEETDDVCASK